MNRGRLAPEISGCLRERPLWSIARAFRDPEVEPCPAWCTDFDVTRYRAVGRTEEWVTVGDDDVFHANLGESNRWRAVLRTRVAPSVRVFVLERRKGNGRANSDAQTKRLSCKTIT